MKSKHTVTDDSKRELAEYIRLGGFPGCAFAERYTGSDSCNAFPQKINSVINIKVEFGEGKVPFDNIAKIAEAYKPKERVTLIKEYTGAKYGFKVYTGLKI